MDQPTPMEDWEEERFDTEKGWSAMQSQQCPQLTPWGILKMRWPFRTVLNWEKRPSLYNPSIDKS